MKTTTLDKLSYVLLVVGGLNWGLVGAFNYNLVDSIFGVESFISRVVYVLVGLAAVYGLVGMVNMMAEQPKHNN